jgi:predicted phosphodiesterase
MLPVIPRVAVLADVHGVLPALEAVLAEPDVASADRIVVCGDLAAGPQPNEVLDVLTSLGDRLVLVRGNADRELVAMAADPALDVGDPVASWAAATLEPRHRALLAALPHPVVLELEGFGEVLFCHGSPRADDEVLLVDTRLERWGEAFDGVPPEVRTVVGGHTHMPYLRLVDRRLVVVPGSVGMPYGRPGAHWALLEGGAVTFRRTEYDVATAVDAIAAGSGYPDARAWADYYLRATAGDVEVLEVFGPRDGREESRA